MSYKRQLETPLLSKVEMQTDACRKHPRKPADPICTSAGRVFEPAGQGKAETHESRATDAEDGGETTWDNWVSA